MLTLSFNLAQTKKGYRLTLTADENGTILHEEKMKAIDVTKMLSVRKKTMNLGGKALTIGINVIGKRNEKVKEVKEAKSISNRRPAQRVLDGKNTKTSRRVSKKRA